MAFKLQYALSAKRDLSLLDKVTAVRIVDKLDWFVAQETPMYFAKRLKGSEPMYRFRVGNYRIVFKTEASGIVSILIVLRIKHRREAYN